MVAEVNKRRAAGWTGTLANGTASTLPPVGPLLATPTCSRRRWRASPTAPRRGPASTRTGSPERRHAHTYRQRRGHREDKGYPETTTYFVDAWMKSDGHRAILMNGRYDSAGFAYSRLGDDQVYFAGEFADFSTIPTPAPPPVITPVPTTTPFLGVPSGPRSSRTAAGSDRERLLPRRRPVAHRDHGRNVRGTSHPRRRPRGPRRRDLPLQLLDVIVERPLPQHRRRDDRLRPLEPHPARRVLVRRGHPQQPLPRRQRTEDMLSIWHSGGKGVGSELIVEDNHLHGLVANTPTRRRGPAARAPGSSSATVRARPTTATSSSATTPC
jgi:hypothetical protein